MPSIGSVESYTNHDTPGQSLAESCGIFELLFAELCVDSGPGRVYRCALQASSRPELVKHPLFVVDQCTRR